jgi:glyoxylase-like metal-dependent hydrolase (beta-lactamase superfamily II)
MAMLLRAVLILISGFTCVAASGASNKALDTVNRAVEAMGGENALRQVKTVVLNVRAQHWEPQSNYQAGGDAKPTGESSIVIARDFGSKAARVDWDRTKVGGGGVNFKYSEIYSDGVGIVDGVNTGVNNRTPQSLKTNQHTMSGIRLASFLREQQRASPLLVLDMKSDPKALTALPDQTVGGKKLPAVRYDVSRYTFTVMFDPATGLPARVRSLDTEPIRGDLNYDLILSDWRPVNGVQFAHQLAWELDGKPTGKADVSKVVVNAAIPAERFAISPEARARRILPAMGNVPYQWVERRVLWGAFRDTDELSFDPEKSPGLTLVDIAPGVSMSQGGSHNNMFVEMNKYLIAYDAPISEMQSRWAIDAAKAKYKKPVKYLIMSHHHWDHANGARTFVAEGATVIVGKGSKDHFARMFSAKHTAIPDELAAKPRKATIIEVADKHIISDGKRQVGAYYIEHSHSTGTLIAYIPDAKLGFVTDIWSPGRDPLPKKAGQGHIELVRGVRQHNLDIERFAAGHGSTGVFRDLVAIVEQTAPRSSLAPLELATRVRP